MTNPQHAPTIWVDADACPVAMKQMLFRAATRAHISVTLVANHTLSIPNSPFLKFIQVEQGFDVADHFISQRVATNDLVITGDIPLAAEVIDKGAVALNPRGELYTRENIRARLNMRDFMETLRSSGVDTGGAAALSQTDKQRFANRLDSWITKAQ
ncbi:YaiI/YqxD family protein [Gilvimarinus sp. 1_MG-2023]|uniref:YaiI/YqxD family protein n=1 Tax=Gilvimarinus sp. 1_MG-2023 TaxID=3062638 RepID=UPI0026E3E979|nr:YaiI/YqxD family protein [Gilvimarinus sp. 1_MG-2023]MDO6746409.1 YaiI/YqxD family protein [Gilvimarinus sp. 1_MG-2023]